MWCATHAWIIKAEGLDPCPEARGANDGHRYQLPDAFREAVILPRMSAMWLSSWTRVSELMCTLRSTACVEGLSQSSHYSYWQITIYIYIHTSGSWGTVKYPVSEGGEAAYTKTNALQHLCFVIAAFCETIGIWNIKSVENILRPIVQSLNTAIMYLSSHKRFRNVRGSR